MDSGVSDHVVCHLELFSKAEKIPERCIVPINWDIASSKYKGTMYLDITIVGTRPLIHHETVIDYIVFVTDVKANMISFPSVCRDGSEIKLKNGK